ncbi:MAG: response regulator transcription factor [Acidobacteria bacterium]|nr:response regulator transcription factor [Acidobacteriota bacterium]
MSHSKPIRVLIVDDHPAVREGLAEMIATQPDMCVAGAACDGVEAIALFGELQPDVTLLDMRLPKLSGLEVLRQLRRVAPGSHIIAMSSFADKLEPALRSGASAFLLKERFGDELLHLIRTIHLDPLAADSEIATPNQS